MEDRVSQGGGGIALSDAGDGSTDLQDEISCFLVDFLRALLPQSTNTFFNRDSPYPAV